MPNRLADEQSPYLLQHKNNPVDWYPWGEEAFEKAKAEDKPVFVSIGYSTCHWCHVMERESFEDEEVAELMNETVVPVKVDREERPDVDNLYMTVCHMMGKQGGWPLNVVLTPEKKPFYAATYLPKQGRFGRMGMMELMPRIEELWSEERDRVLQEADKVTGALQEASEQEAGSDALEKDTLDRAYEQLTNQFDAVHGGFAQAPKFPAPHNLLFLLRYYHRTEKDQALRMVTKTLDGMRKGGVYDHVGFGFHRYSTDAQWLLPHFEKMLYDQALLTMAYTEGHQVTGSDMYEQTAREIITYVLRDLRGEEGAFYSAEDADSEDESGEREEGAFYVWSIDQVRDVLNEERADLVIDAFNLREEGNYQDEATGQRTGKNVLHRTDALAEVAERHSIEPDTCREELEIARQRLYDAREERHHPHLDDKILTDWNGLMIAALAKAGRAFDDASFVEVAEEAADFVLDTLRDEDGRLLHRYRNGEASIRAHLDDYAYLVWGLIELYQTTFDASWLGEALCLTNEMLDHCWDEERGGLFLTADDGEPLIARQKTYHDGAIPSGNSVALYNLARLGRMTGRPEWEQRAAGIAQAAAPQVDQRPSGFTGLLTGLDFALGPTQEVVIVGRRESSDTRTMIQKLRSLYSPRTITIVRQNDKSKDPVEQYAPFLDEYGGHNDRATAYVCQNYRCEAPTTDPDEMVSALQAR